MPAAQPVSNPLLGFQPRIPVSNPESVEFGPGCFVGSSRCTRLRRAARKSHALERALVEILTAGAVAKWRTAQFPADLPVQFRYSARLPNKAAWAGLAVRTEDYKDPC
jgi:hypothetical protein